MVDHRLWPLHLQGLGAGGKQQHHAANAVVLASSLLQGRWDSSPGVLLTAAGSLRASGLVCIGLDNQIQLEARLTPWQS